MMKSTPFGYGAFKYGLLLLLLAIILALGASYTTPQIYEESGVLKEGDNKDFYIPYAYNRIIEANLILNSKNATVLYSIDSSPEAASFEGNLTIPGYVTSISIIHGNVDYRFYARAQVYSYPYLGYVAFLLMIIGTVLTFSGYMRFLRDLRGGKR